MLTGMSSITNLHVKYIRGTAKGAVVSEVTIVACTLTGVVQRVAEVTSPKVYLSTRALKHLYDKRPAEEYEFLLQHGWRTIHLPDEIYYNRSSKRGDLLFVKAINNHRYLCSAERVVDPLNQNDSLHIATMFRINKQSYLRDYSLLWSWRGGTPSS